MKFIDSVEIGIPREEVLRLLLDPVHLPMWLRGLVLQESLSGGHSEVGSVSRLVVRQGAAEIETTETITRREPAGLVEIPGETDVMIERELVAEGMRGVSRDRIFVMNPRRTRWECENEYRFDSLKMRLLSPMMREEFQTRKRRNMRDFKAFAEQGVDVRSIRR